MNTKWSKTSLSYLCENIWVMENLLNQMKFFFPHGLMQVTCLGPLPLSPFINILGKKWKTYIVQIFQLWILKTKVVRVTIPASHVHSNNAYFNTTKFKVFPLSPRKLLCLHGFVTILKKLRPFRHYRKIKWVHSFSALISPTLLSHVKHPDF